MPYLQGQENDIILLSLVRSSKSRIIGHLSSTNRLCVAISRARCGLYLFGNDGQLSKASKPWKVGYDVLGISIPCYFPKTTQSGGTIKTFAEKQPFSRKYLCSIM